MLGGYSVGFINLGWHLFLGNWAQVRTKPTELNFQHKNSKLRNCKNLSIPQSSAQRHLRRILLAEGRHHNTYYTCVHQQFQLLWIFLKVVHKRWNICVTRRQNIRDRRMELRPLRHLQRQHPNPHHPVHLPPQTVRQLRRIRQVRMSFLAFQNTFQFANCEDSGRYVPPPPLPVYIPS